MLWICRATGQYQTGNNSIVTVKSSIRTDSNCKSHGKNGDFSSPQKVSHHAGRSRRYITSLHQRLQVKNTFNVHPGVNSDMQHLLCRLTA